MKKELAEEELDVINYEDITEELTEDDIINSKTPNVDQLDKAIKYISSKYPKTLSEEEIRNTLKKNKFRGIFNLTKEEFEYIEGSTETYDDSRKLLIRILGYFKYSKKYIAIADEVDDIDTISHEVLHAYFNQRLNKIINIVGLNDPSKLNYGYGLEEGVVTALSKMKDINDIHNVTSHMYNRYLGILRQLSIIYNNQFDGKDRNLMKLIIKRPEELLPVIYKMYYVTLKSNSSSKNYKDSEIVYIAQKCALDLIVSLDQIEKSKTKESNYLFAKAEYINALMLQQLRPDFKFKEDEETVNNAFYTNGYKQVYERANSSEKILLCSIFGTPMQEDDRMIDRIELLNAEGVIKEEEYLKIEKYEKENTYVKTYKK